jgi:hypothetical protein
MSDIGTFLPCQPRQAMSAIGGIPADICSLRGFLIEQQREECRPQITSQPRRWRQKAELGVDVTLRMHSFLRPTRETLRWRNCSSSCFNLKAFTIESPPGFAQVCAWKSDTPRVHWCRRGIAPGLAQSRAATTETPRRPTGAGGAVRREPVRLGVRHHHTRSLCDESAAQSAENA